MVLDEILRVIKSRRSVRSFTRDPVPREKVETLIEAASWAPSNHNRQGWKFIVFEDSRTIRGLAERVREFVKQSAQQAPRLAAGHQEELIRLAGEFDRAPVMILVMHKKSLSIARSILASAAHEDVSGELISAAMACQNLLLAAHAMGLGACIMTAPLLAGPVWTSLDSLPANFEPTCVIALGYPAELSNPPRRKKIEQIVEYRR
jgi:coenzyme F420-0:L-glutamate ligase / coenzyme F420-1:gamma-L-glutamate ligase